MPDLDQAPMTAGPQKNWSPDFPRDILPIVNLYILESLVFAYRWFSQANSHDCLIYDAIGRLFVEYMI